MLLAAQLGFAQAQETSGSETAPTSQAELERLGATIRAIHITVDNVFDLSNPEENKRLYRWANRAHIRTRESAIASVLLFRVGDRYSGQQLEESARTLRNRGYLAS